MERAVPAPGPESEPAAIPSPRLDLRRVPGFVWLVCAVHVVLLLVGSLARPMLNPAIPDEQHHVDMIAAVGDGAGWPPIQGRDLQPASVGSRRLLQNPMRTEETAIPRRTAWDSEGRVCVGTGPPTCRHRPTFAELEREYPELVGSANRMTQHPPLYYVVTQNVAHAALTLVPTSTGVPFDLQILSYRWVSILLLAPLPLLVYELARLLTTSEPARRTAVLFPLAVAGLEMRNGPLVNNDNLLLLLVTLLTIVLVRMMVVGPSWGRAVSIGLLTGLALFTKGLALVLPAVVILAFVVRWRRHRTEGRTLAKHVAVAGLIALASGGWWWFRNLALYGQVQPSGQITEPAPTDFVPTIGDWLGQGYPQMFRSFWGTHLFGGGMDQWLPALMLVVLVVLVVVGVRGSDHRSALVVALSPVLFIGVVLFLTSWDFYVFSGKTNGIDHGRYAYSAIAALSVAFGIGLWRTLERVGAGFLAVALSGVAVVAIELRSVERLLAMYWGSTGGDDLGEAYRSMVAWSPLARVVTNGVMVLFALACMALLAGAIRETLRDRRRAGPAPDAPLPDPVGVGA